MKKGKKTVGKNVRKFKKNAERDTSHEIDRIDRDIASLTDLIEKFGFGSYEAQRAENKVRQLRTRRNKLQYRG